MNITIKQSLKARASQDIEMINKIKDRLASFVPYWKSPVRKSIRGGSEFEVVSADFRLYLPESRLLERVSYLNDSYSKSGIEIMIGK